MKLVSPAGEMTIDFTGARRDGEQLVILSKLGLWESELFVSQEDIDQITRIMLNGATLGFILRIPYYTLKSKFRKRPQAAEESGD